MHLLDAIKQLLATHAACAMSAWSKQPLNPAQAFGLHNSSIDDLKKRLQEKREGEGGDE